MACTSFTVRFINVAAASVHKAESHHCLSSQIDSIPASNKHS